MPGPFPSVAAAACVLVSATLNSTTRTDSRPIFSPTTRHVAKVVGWPTFSFVVLSCGLLCCMYALRNDGWAI